MTCLQELILHHFELQCLLTVYQFNSKFISITRWNCNRSTWRHPASWPAISLQPSIQNFNNDLSKRLDMYVYDQPQINVPLSQVNISFYQSTQTSYLKSHHDLLSVSDDGNISVLTCFDWFAAVDTVNHDVSVHRLENVFDVHRAPLTSSNQFLSLRKQIVNVNRNSSVQTVLSWYPTGLCSWIILLFILYSRPLSTSRSLSRSKRSDDTQLKISSCPIEIIFTI